MKKLTTALVAICAAMGAYASTSISGNFTIDHALTADERPLIITGDATITVAAEVDTFLGAVTNNGHTVTINLESGSKAQVSWFTVRGGGTTTINFNGGALTDAGGWGSPWFDTVSGSTVALVSVDGNPIRVTQSHAQSKKWNTNLGGGTPGRVTTSGTGRCDLLSSALSGSTKLSLTLCGCSESDWGHTGGTYLGHYNEAGERGYVVCSGANVLPAGDIYLGTANGLSPVELNLRSYPQSVERIHLQNASSTVIREGTAAVLNFTGANAGIVSAATTTPSLSIPAVTVASGATLTVDHVAITVSSSFSNLGAVAYANGGTLTAAVGAATDNAVLSDTAPLNGATRIVKNGAGAFSYAGDAALDIGALTVSAGEFRLSGPRGTTNRWWRFTVKHRVNVSTNLTHVVGMRLFGSDLKPADGVRPDPDYSSVQRTKFTKKSKDVAVSSFAAYDYSLTYNSGAYDNLTITPDSANAEGNSTINWGYRRDPRVLWNDVLNNQTHIGCEIKYPYPQRTQPAHWIAWTYRIPDGRPVYGYNLKKDDGFWNYPTDWSLESSADGVTWETMDAQTNYPVASGIRYWFNGAGNVPGEPSSLIDFGSQVKPTLPTEGGLASDVNIKVASGATFDASLVTGGQEISTLTVDYAGGGTLKGVRFASTGTLYLNNVTAGADINEFAIPLTFVGAADTANLANWTAVISFSNGTSREKKLYWDNGVMRIRPSGITIIIR
jgi:hypothetical protein